ncbi:4a-hydroxytetrahydrobiopterin dehydratase [Actinoplanes sp. NPDC026619]|uniref:4a-hydroxytetrahydrobiopterin dehydratase n=1 Tax=Actinoplanes sp. NPDC026619 TaxID=3155798 RepID=UPI0033FF32F5
MTKLTGRQVAAEGLADWALLYNRLHTRVRSGTFAAGLALVDAIGAAAEEVDHHPDLDLRYTHVDVRLTSHDTGGVTERDVALARTVSGLIADAGLEHSFAGLTWLELGLDSPDHAEIAPFWEAILGFERRTGEYDEEIVDPSGALPTIWFQESGRDEPRQRWHPDLWIDPSEVRRRINDAVAAGGTLESDAEAPSFWVLADPQGNRVCLCTWQDRV